MKNFLKTYYVELGFALLFILMLGFFALPFMDVALKSGMEGEEVAYSTFSLSLYSLMSGGKFGDVLLMPDGTFILTFVFLLIAGYLVALQLFIKKENVKKIVVSSALALIFTSVVILCVSNTFLPSYDYLRGWMDPYVKLCDESDFNALGFSLVLIVLILMMLILSTNIFKDAKFKVSDIVEISMLVALAVVLDKVKLFQAPTGGSVNLAGIALMILSLRHGPFKSFIASSIVFGLITCIIDGYGFQTYPFDYFIAFLGYMVPGLAYSIFKATVLKDNTNRNKDLLYMNISLVLGFVGVFVTRMIGSTTSSMIYFMEYLEDKTIVGAILYNVGYIGISAAISLAACMVLSKPLEMINHLYPVKK